MKKKIKQGFILDREKKPPNKPKKNKKKLWVFKIKDGQFPRCQLLVYNARI